MQHFKRHQAYGKTKRGFGERGAQGGGARARANGSDLRGRRSAGCWPRPRAGRGAGRGADGRGPVGADRSPAPQGKMAHREPENWDRGGAEAGAEGQRKRFPEVGGGAESGGGLERPLPGAGERSAPSSAPPRPAVMPSQLGVPGEGPGTPAGTAPRSRCRGQQCPARLGLLSVELETGREGEAGLSSQSGPLLPRPSLRLGLDL